MGHRQRFVVEAEWSGYVSSQRRIVHRTVETLFRAGYDALQYHSFSDGTGLTISVRDCKPREKVQQIHGYGQLLRDRAMDAWQAQRNAQTVSSSQTGD